MAQSVNDYYFTAGRKLFTLISTYLNMLLDMYVNMKNIIPISDLQRQAAQVLIDVNASSEPIIITQRGRASAVLLSAKRYAEIEKDLEAFDDLELEVLIEEGLRDRADGNTLTSEEVKKRLNYPG